MKLKVPDVVEKARIKGDRGYYPGEFYGDFVLRIGDSHLFVIAGKGEHGIWPFPGEPWDHVSVSVRGEKRCPTWEEMCRVKDLFFDEEECVVQYHPPKSDYVNTHNYVLHLWRPTESSIVMPPEGTV